MKLANFKPVDTDAFLRDVTTWFYVDDVRMIWVATDTDGPDVWRADVISSDFESNAVPSSTNRARYLNLPNTSIVMDLTNHITYIKSGDPGKFDGTWAAQN